MALLPHVVFVVNDHPYCRVREVQMRRLVFYAGRTVNLVWTLCEFGVGPACQAIKDIRILTRLMLPTDKSGLWGKE